MRLHVVLRHALPGGVHEAEVVLRDGMTLVTDEGEGTHLEAEAREVFDVSGAGDTVVATMAAALSVGADLTSAAALANVAAGIVIGKVGTLLGDNGVNISQFELSRNRPGGEAMSVIRVDGPVDSAVLDGLRALPAVVTLHAISI